MTTVTTTGRLRTSVAEEVRVLLARRRMSGVKLAAAIDRTQAYVSRRLNGDVAFDVDDLERIASALGVEVVDLIPGAKRDRAYYPQRAERPADNRPSGRPKSAHAKDSLRRPRSTGNLKAVLAQAVAA